VAVGAGVGGCLIGAFFGYMAAEQTASIVYGWAEGTQFIPGARGGDACVSPNSLPPVYPVPQPQFDFGPMP
jgi:hypothetical protein